MTFSPLAYYFATGYIHYNGSVESIGIRNERHGGPALGLGGSNLAARPKRDRRVWVNHFGETVYARRLYREGKPKASWDVCTPTKDLAGKCVWRPSVVTAKVIASCTKMFDLVCTWLPPCTHIEQGKTPSTYYSLEGNCNPQRSGRVYSIRDLKVNLHYRYERTGRTLLATPTGAVVRKWGLEK